MLERILLVSPPYLFILQLRELKASKVAVFPIYPVSAKDRMNIKVLGEFLCYLEKDIIATPQTGIMKEMGSEGLIKGTVLPGACNS